jgi:hypothetical protein
VFLLTQCFAANRQVELSGNNARNPSPSLYMSSFFPWQRGEQQWKQRKDRQSFILDTKCRICTAPASFALSGSGETRRERDIVAKEKSSASMSTKMQKEV